MNVSDDLNTVAYYLAQRDMPNLSTTTISKPVDVLVLLGSSLIEPIHVAAKAMRSGLAKHLVISGGVGHSTHYLYDTVSTHPIYRGIPTASRPEADIIWDILVTHLGVNQESLVIESKSTNCGSNASESRLVIDDLGIPSGSLLLIQDPTMQRRTHACFERSWSDRPSTQLTSFSPFIPTVSQSNGSYTINGSSEKTWPFERFMELCLGEIPRLRDDEDGYGPKGRNFIGHIDIPTEVLNAYERLRRHYAGSTRDIPA